MAQLANDVIVRQMLADYTSELKKMVIKGQAFYEGEKIIGLTPWIEEVDRMNNVISAYNIYGSTVELVKLAHEHRGNKAGVQGLYPTAQLDMEDLTAANLAQPVRFRWETEDTINFKIPPEVQPYANDLRRFLDAMAYKIGRNAHKGKWESTSINDAVELLRKEVEELVSAINSGNTIEIVLEAADVANFAMIAASIAIDGKKS